MPAVISIGAGPGQLPLIRAAKELGHQVVAVDRSPVTEALGLIDEAIIVSTYDVDIVIESVLKLNPRYDFHAVLARTSGPALLTAAKVAEVLGLSGIPKGFADVAVSKSELRCRALSLGIATPQGVCVADYQPPTIAGPWVVKPDMPLVGKKNVYKVDVETDYHQAYVAARAESYNDAVEVESFLVGVDVGFMAIVHQGNIEYGLLYDEFATFNNGKVKGLGVGGPSVFSGSSIEMRCRDAARKLLSHWRYQVGFAFFSFRINEQGKAWLYEVNPGLCGDAIADRLLPALWPGFDPFACEVKLQMGVRPELPSNSTGQNLVLDGQLIHTDNMDDYLSNVANIEGGADIVAMSRATFKQMRER